MFLFLFSRVKNKGRKKKKSLHFIFFISVRLTSRHQKKNMGLFGSKKNEFDHPEDGVIALVPPLSAPRVPIDDGEGRLTLVR